MEETASSLLHGDRWKRIMNICWAAPSTPSGKNCWVLSLAALHDKFEEGKLVSGHIGNAVHWAEVDSLAHVLSVICPLCCDSRSAIVIFLINRPQSQVDNGSYPAGYESVVQLGNDQLVWGYASLH